MTKTKLDKIKDLKKENKIKKGRKKKRKTWCDEFLIGYAYKRAIGETEKEDIDLGLPEDEVKDLCDIFRDNEMRFTSGE